LDPITHFLTGGCLARAGFNRKSRLATLTMVLAAEAADIDVVWAFKGSIEGLQHHRGITHSFVGVPFIAAFALAIVFAIHWLWQRKGRESIKAPPTLPIRWGYLYFLALLAALSHLLLDYSTAYGIRLFEPFNYRWYSWDIVYIVDPVIWLLLLAGLCLPALFGLINQEIGARSKGPRGRAAAIVALGLYGAILVGRDVQHRRATDVMNAFTYQGATAERVAAYPYMINPFHWHGVVETANFFETVPVDSLRPEVTPEGGRIYYKPEETNASQAAKSSYLGRVYLDWAVFPYVTVQNFTGGFLAEFQDLRYTYPEMHGGRSPLTGYVVLNRGLVVLDEGMNSRRSPTVESLEREPSQ